MKITNTNKHKKPITRLLPNFSTKFSSVSELKSCLNEEIDEIQDNCGIDVGYTTRRPSDKVKLVCDAQCMVN